MKKERVFMPNSKWTKYGMLTLAAAIILVADVGLGIYVSKLANENKLSTPKSISSLFPGLFPKKILPSIAPPPAPPNSAETKAMVQGAVGKKITHIFVGGFNLVTVDKSYAEKMASTSAGIVSYNQEGRPGSVLYGFIKTIEKDRIIILQNNQDIAVSVATPFSVVSSSAGIFTLVSYDDNDATHALSALSYQANGRPAVFYGVVRKGDNWTASSVIVYR